LAELQNKINENVKERKELLCELEEKEETLQTEKG
jgi:hypothetical protein